MEFEQRLKRAIERGQHVSKAKAQAEMERALSEEELKRLHAGYRLELSEHIEACLNQLAQHFPGFQFGSVVDERGWGAAVSRDDMGVASGHKRANYFSRLEMLVRPYSQAHVLELAAKGTVRNREVYNRSRYQGLAEADTTSFQGMIDLWVLEFAELYAAAGLR